jgi:EpsD family peptidyl-prolyl cis-trans isomerase
MPLSKLPGARCRLVLLSVATAGALLAACGEKRPVTGGEPAARVNKAELTTQQINLVLQQQRNLRPEQADAAGRAVLERLIDQELAVQKAASLELDRDARVIQLVEAARREVLARAYAEKVSEGASKPTADEVRRYYSDKPALFAERKVYTFTELTIEARPDQVAGLRERLSAGKGIGEFIEYLKANEFRFGANQGTRAAEQLPLSSLDTVSRMQVGQAILAPAANGAQVIVLSAVRSQPVDEERARPSIEQFLLNERKRKLVEEDLKSLRSAAKVEYLGKFVPPPAAGASSAPAAPAAASK